MKSINIIITLLSLAYATITAKAQVANDTVKINFKGKNYEIQNQLEPDEDERSKTLRFRDTINKKVTLIKVTTKKDDGLKWDTESSATRSDSTAKQKVISAIKKRNDKTKRKHFIETDFLTDVQLGFVDIMAENNVNAKANLDPRTFRSANISFNIISQDMNLYKNRLLLSYGIGVNNYYIKYKNTQNVYYLNGAGHLNSFNDTVNTYNKNRMDVRYINIPVILEYHDKKDKFKIAAGVEFGINGRVKMTQKGERSEGDFTNKFEKDLKINPVQINAIVKIGIEDICLFGRYTITNMYKDDAFANGQNPNQHLVSVGVCIGGF